MQAAVGCAQLKKLPTFIRKRKENWEKLYKGLRDLDDVLIFQKPIPTADPSWFGFFMILRSEAKIDRRELVERLEKRGIQTRLLFAGNMTRQPCFHSLEAEDAPFRVVGDLKNSDLIMNRGFWLGVYPGLSNAMVNYMIKTVREEITSLRNAAI